MKTVALLYNSCCIYEIVILNYFLQYAGKDVVFVSRDGKPIHAMEGYTIHVSDKLLNISPKDVELMIVPGGTISEIDHPEVWGYLADVRFNGGRIAAICAGVDILDHAGILETIESTHSCDPDVVTDGNVITARANGYVDFAIETAKQMDLFADEADLKETIAFWRDYKRMQ